MSTLFSKIKSHSRSLVYGEVGFSEIFLKARTKVRKALRVRLSSVELWFAYNNKTSVVQSSTSRRSIIFSRLSANPNEGLYFTNVKSGSYVLEVAFHEDVRPSEQSLQAYIKLSNNPISKNLAKRMLLSCGDKKDYYYDFEKTQLDDGSFGLISTISVPHNQRWVKILFANIDTFNIKQIRFFQKDNSWMDEFASRAIPTYVESRPELMEVKFLIYADINLNVVDGSSIWLTSVLSLFSELGKTILISKTNIETDITISNISSSENKVILLQPKDINALNEVITMEQAIPLLKYIDHELPLISNIIVRGLDAAFFLTQTRQYYDRLLVYLTDFYSHDTNGVRLSAPIVERKVKQVVNQSLKMMIQTPQIGEYLRSITLTDFSQVDMPPVLPKHTYPSREIVHDLDERIINIGYAGKITPDWGMVELLEWIDEIETDGEFKFQLTIVANKITEKGIKGHVNGFSDKIVKKMNALNAIHYTDMNRSEAIKEMLKMDFVWCWRPWLLESNTLELSTKLIEMVAYGKKCICYPNDINRQLLADDYPFFVKTSGDLERVLGGNDRLSQALSLKVKNRFSYDRRLDFLRSDVININKPIVNKNVVFAGHDFKFIEPYISHLKSQSYSVRRDNWSWGDHINIERSSELLMWADTIFCEWGLQNSVWYSNQELHGKKLYIRIHLQEIKERARKFGYEINIKSVEKIIFVSEEVRKQAVELFGWPESKTLVIPNFVLDDEYSFDLSDKLPTLNIGMVGIIPQRKRFDIAVNVLESLISKGYDSKLYIKGPRPENIDFMHSPSRRSELLYYQEIYQIISDDLELSSRVIFEPWGNDVSIWYKNIDYILSCSDFESFHYALADGVIGGCHPIVWPWSEADTIYTSEWIVNDTDEAVDRIIKFNEMSNTRKQKIRDANRELIVSRYGRDIVFKKLSSLLFM